MQTQIINKFLNRKQLTKCKVLAYMCDAILCANNSVLYILAKLNEVIFWKVMSAMRENSRSASCIITSNHNQLNSSLQLLYLQNNKLASLKLIAST